MAPAAAQDTVLGLLATHDVPGLALGTVRDGKVVWAGGYGARDAGAETPVTDRTVFEAASLSKPVFAYIVLELGRMGTIDLDAPVGEYVPDLHEPDSRVGTVTARQILSHTSGFPPRLQDTAVRLEDEPGERWRYSGAGYVFLQHAVEKVTGESLETLARRLVFTPLGMSRTSFVWRTSFGDDAASPHDSIGRPLDPARYDAADVDRAGAASTLYTTAGDFARFIAAISEAGAEPWIREMFQPQVVVDAQLAMSWGLGWAIHDGNDVEVAFHWGANPHFRSFAMIHPGEGHGWVSLTNGPLGLELMDELTGILTGSVPRLFDFYMLHPTD